MLHTKKKLAPSALARLRLSLEPEGKKGLPIRARSFAIKIQFSDWEKNIIKRLHLSIEGLWTAIEGIFKGYNLFIFFAVEILFFCVSFSSALGCFLL